MYIIHPIFITIIIIVVFVVVKVVVNYYCHSFVTLFIKLSTVEELYNHSSSYYFRFVLLYVVEAQHILLLELKCFIFF